MHTATLLILALPLASQFDVAAPRAEVIAPVQCFPESIADSVHLDDVANEPIAVLGANWWVPRFESDGTQRFPVGATLLLSEATSAVSIEVGDRWETAAAVAITVPSSASPGEVYTLTANGQLVETLRVAVGEVVASDGALTNVEVVAGDAQRCDVFCAVDGLTVPATPRLRVVHTGGPLVLDAIAIWEGDFANEEWTHRADSFALPAVTEPTTIEIDLDQLGWDAALDVYVRARDPGDLTLLHDEVLAVAPLGSLPADVEGLQACDTGGRGQTVGCPFFGGSSIALLFAPVLALRLRRLKRRSSRS